MHLEHVLVGRVVGQHVADIDVAECSHDARKCQPPALRAADIRRGELRFLSLPVEPVVVRSYGAAKFIRAAERTIGVVLGLDLDRRQSRWRTGHRADLGLPLAEIAPVGVAVAEATLARLVDDKDHAHERDVAEGIGGGGSR